MQEPWSNKHKRVTKASQGGVKFSLSNSFAQPTSQRELRGFTSDRGDHELLEMYDTHTLEYTANGGSLDLQNEIAKLYSSSISAENILVFPGAQIALQTAAVALAREHHSIVFTPGYQSTVMGPEHAGGKVTMIPLSAADEWRVPLDKVRRAIIPGETKYIVINEPYNPAGTLMKPEDQLQLVRIAEKYDVRIMSDEVYRLLEHDESDRLPAMADLYMKGISCVTMSKPWGACGVSIGWLAFQDLSIKQALTDVQYFGCACPSRSSEIQAMMTLRASDVILERNMKIIRHNLKLLDAFMVKFSDLFEWVRPKAGAVAFLKFNGPMTSEELGEELASVGIGIKPAYCFSKVVTDEIDYFRVGYGEVKMAAALECLESHVEKRAESWRAARGSRL